MARFLIVSDLQSWWSACCGPISASLARPVARRYRHRAGDDGLCPAGDLLAEPAAELVCGSSTDEARDRQRSAMGVPETYRCGCAEQEIGPKAHWTAAWDYCRYCWMRVVRRPARPCWSIDTARREFLDRQRIAAAGYSSERSPPRTAATTSALRG